MLFFFLIQQFDYFFSSKFVLILITGSVAKSMKKIIAKIK